MSQDNRFNVLLEPIIKGASINIEEHTNKMFQKANEALKTEKKEPLAEDDGLAKAILYAPQAELISDSNKYTVNFLSELVNVATNADKIAYSVSCSEESLTNGLQNNIDGVKKAIVLNTTTAGEVHIYIKKSESFVEADEDKIAKGILDYLPVGSTDFTVGTISKDITIQTNTPISHTQIKTIRWDYTTTRYFSVTLKYTETTEKGLSLDLTNSIKSIFISLLQEYYKDNAIGRDIYYQPFGLICEKINQIAEISLSFQEYNPIDNSNIGTPFVDTNVPIGVSELSFIRDELAIEVQTKKDKDKVQTKKEKG